MMPLAASLILLLAATPSADAVGMGRKDFAKCLSAQVQPALDRKMPLGDFQAALRQACADKQSAFRAALVAQGKADGLSDTQANADADEQIAEYVDKITSEYEDSTRPG